MPKLDDFQIQNRNVNRHTRKGMERLEASMHENGWIGAITAAADGEIFDGSARRETLENTLNTDPIVVESDGTRPIIIKRMDIPNALDPRAIRLGIAANKIAADNLAWDADEIAALNLESPELLKNLFDDTELMDLLASITPPDVEFKEYDESTADDVKYHECPECGHRFPQ